MVLTFIRYYFNIMAIEEVVVSYSDILMISLSLLGAIGTIKIHLNHNILDQAYSKQLDKRCLTLKHLCC